jgi:hypothetical protein
VQGPIVLMPPDHPAFARRLVEDLIAKDLQVFRASKGGPNLRDPFVCNQRLEAFCYRPEQPELEDRSVV